MTDHGCDHALWHWTIRTHSNDSTHIVKQCRVCGQQLGGAIPKHGTEAGDPRLLPPFDTDLADAYWKTRHERAGQARLFPYKG